MGKTLLDACSEMPSNVKKCYKSRSGIEILVTWENCSEAVSIPNLFMELHGRPEDLAVGPQ